MRGGIKKTLNYEKLYYNSWGSEAIPLGFEKDYEHLRQMLLGGSEWYFHEARLQLFYAWIVDSTFLHFPVFVCALDGTVLEVSEDLCFHESLIAYEEWKTAEVPVSLGYLQCENAFSGHPMDIWDGFEAFNVHTGIVRTLQPSEKMLATRSQNTDYGRNIDQNRMELSRHFDGWAICFKESDVSLEEEDKLLQVFGLDPNCFANDDGEYAGLRNKMQYGHISHRVLGSRPINLLEAVVPA